MNLEIIWAIITGLIIGTILTYLLMRSKIAGAVLETKTKMESELGGRIEQATKLSLQQQRSTLKGKIGEQMAPLLPEFTEKFEPADARFIGTPVDYVIFKNMHTWNGGQRLPVEIVFVDVKTGRSNPSPVQNAIRDAVPGNRVSFDILRPSIESQKDD